MWHVQGFKLCLKKMEPLSLQVDAIYCRLVKKRKRLFYFWQNRNRGEGSREGGRRSARQRTRANSVPLNNSPALFVSPVQPAAAITCVVFSQLGFG